LAEVAHITRDSDTALKVRRSTVNLQGAGTYCGGLPHNLFNWKKSKSTKIALMRLERRYVKCIKMHSIL